MRWFIYVVWLIGGLIVGVSLPSAVLACRGGWPMVGVAMLWAAIAFRLLLDAEATDRGR